MVLSMIYYQLNIPTSCFSLKWELQIKMGITKYNPDWEKEYPWLRAQPPDHIQHIA